MRLRQQPRLHVAHEVRVELLQDRRRRVVGVRPVHTVEILAKELLQKRQLPRIHLAAAASRVHSVHPGPFLDQGLENLSPLRRVLLRRVLLHQPPQCTAFVADHGLAQIVHIPETHEVGQCRDVLRDIQNLVRNGVHRDAVRQCLRNRARTPVLPLERAFGADRTARLPERTVRLARLVLQGQDPLIPRQLREVALGKRGRRTLVYGLRGYVQALDSRIGQARHLPFARQDLQRGVDLVGGIDLAVPVGVVCLEGVEASEGQGPIRQGHDVAEQLTSVVRLAVEVLVQHQKRVRLVDPPRELVEAVGVQVKKRRVLQLHLPVPVQVQDQRVASGGGALRSTPISRKTQTQRLTSALRKQNVSGPIHCCPPNRS